MSSTTIYTVFVDVATESPLTVSARAYGSDEIREVVGSLLDEVYRAYGKVAGDTATAYCVVEPPLDFDVAECQLLGGLIGMKFPYVNVRRLVERHIHKSVKTPIENLQHVVFELTRSDAAEPFVFSSEPRPPYENAEWRDDAMAKAGYLPPDPIAIRMWRMEKDLVGSFGFTLRCLSASFDIKI